MTFDAITESALHEFAGTHAMTRPAFEAVSSRLPPHLVPALVARLVDTHSLDAAVLPFAVTCAWRATDRPTAALSESTWLSLWRASGYTVDGETAPRPVEPVHLYRGVPERYAPGLAWTPRYDDARAYADAWTGARVWSAKFEPRLVRAVIGATTVADTRFVVICAAIDPALLHPYS